MAGQRSELYTEKASWKQSIPVSDVNMNNIMKMLWKCFHAGVEVNIVAAQQEASGFTSSLETFLVGAFMFFPLSVWLFSGCSSFPHNYPILVLNVYPSFISSQPFIMPLTQDLDLVPGCCTVAALCSSGMGSMHRAKFAMQIVYWWLMGASEKCFFFLENKLVFLQNAIC